MPELGQIVWNHARPTIVNVVGLERVRTGPVRLTARRPAGPAPVPGRPQMTPIDGLATVPNLVSAAAYG